ncbi:MAG TPA: flagellar biosynthetic protein FliO [Nocardioides sp.]|nr:flagellar biosynthetic protein FliO [Nocardioides sp.]
MLELTIRLVFSLAVVIGLLLLLARLGSRRFRGQSDALVRVLHRQPISRHNAVTVVAVGSRVLVLGTTEHEVRVLTELEPGELEETLPVAALPAPRPRGAHRAEAPVITTAPTKGPLTGSVLSPATWRQALAAASRRTT